MPSQGTNTTSPSNVAVIVETLMNVAGRWLSTPGTCQGSASCSRVQRNPPLRAPHLRRARRRSETSSAARPLRTQHFVLLEAEFEEILCPYWNLRADFVQQRDEGVRSYSLKHQRNTKHGGVKVKQHLTDFYLMGTVIYTLHSSKVRGFKWQKLKACSFLLLFLTYHIDAQPVFKVIKGFYQNIKQQEDALLLHCQHRCILLHPSLLLTATADDYKTATVYLHSKRTNSCPRHPALTTKPQVEIPRN